MVRFLRTALTGEKVSEDYDTFSVKGFKLGIVPEQQPPILVAALREGMLRLAGREGDGAIINWLSADDVRDGRAASSTPGGEGKEVVARIFVAPADRHRHGPGDGPVRRSPPTSTSRCTPSSTVARPGRDAPADVGRVGGGRPQGGARRHPRRGGRRSSSSTGRPRSAASTSAATSTTASPRPALAVLPFGARPAPGHPRPRARPPLKDGATVPVASACGTASRRTGSSTRSAVEGRGGRELDRCDSASAQVTGIDAGPFRPSPPKTRWRSPTTLDREGGVRATSP